MSAPPVKKNVANCQHKVRYADELGARAAVSVLCEQYPDKKMGVYLCPVCSRWHATCTCVSQGREVTADDPCAGKKGGKKYAMKKTDETERIIMLPRMGDNIKLCGYSWFVKDRPRFGVVVFIRRDPNGGVMTGACSLPHWTQQLRAAKGSAV